MGDRDAFTMINDCERVVAGRGRFIVLPIFVLFSAKCTNKIQLFSGSTGFYKVHNLLECDEKYFRRRISVYVLGVIQHIFYIKSF